VVLGDRIGVMRDGKLLQIGTPDEVYNRPAEPFVANFTGATNELVGTLVARTAPRHGRYRRRATPRGRTDARARDRRENARVALRPENIRIGGLAGANCFRARVVDRRYQGKQTVYDIDPVRPANGGCWNWAPPPVTKFEPTRRFHCRRKHAGPTATPEFR